MENHQTAIDKQLADTVATDKASTASSKSSLQDFMSKYLGVQSSQAQQEQNANIPGLSTVSNDAFTALQSSKRAQKSEVDALLAQPGGNSQAKSQAIGDINRRYASTQADLTITMDVANRNLTSAQNMVDRKIQLQLEPLKTAIDFQKTFYQDNRDQLSKAESNQLQNMITENTRAYDSQKSVGDVLKSAITNGVKLTPEILSQVNSAKSANDAYSILAKNGVSLQNPLDVQLKQAQIRAASAKAGVTVNGSAGGYTPIDTSTIANKNAGNPLWGGLSYNGLNNAAQLYLSANGKMPALGLGSSPTTMAKRDSIVNYAGQLADSLNMSLPQISAMYKANSTTATKIVERVGKIDAVTNSLANQFPRLIQLSKNVGNLGIQESDLTAGKAAVASKFGSVDAGNYVELITTIRNEYAAMQSAVSGSQGGQFFAESAQKAVPIGLTPEQYQGLQQTIQLSAINAQKGTSDEATKLIGNIGSMSLGNDSSSGLSVTDPEGGVHTFTDQKSMESFKKAAGIQ